MKLSSLSNQEKRLFLAFEWDGDLPRLPGFMSVQAT
jgi:hypothetical protein